jgi:hypothetical protein
MSQRSIRRERDRKHDRVRRPTGRLHLHARREVGPVGDPVPFKTCLERLWSSFYSCFGEGCGQMLGRVGGTQCFSDEFLLPMVTA